MQSNENLILLHIPLIAADHSARQVFYGSVTTLVGCFIESAVGWFLWVNITYIYFEDFNLRKWVPRAKLYCKMVASIRLN